MRPGSRAKPEVFVHVESHEMRDVASPTKGSSISLDPHGKSAQPPGRGGVVVVIPPSGYPSSTRATEPSLSSESDTLPPYSKASKGYRS